MIEFILGLMLMLPPNDIISERPPPVAAVQVEAETIVSDDLATLYKAREENGKGIVVLVTMEGCAPCAALKDRIKDGKLREALEKVNFGIIDKNDPKVKPYLEKQTFPQIFKIFRENDKDYIVRVVGNVADQKILDIITREKQ